MNERLSDMVDAALRWHSECWRPLDQDIEREAAARRLYGRLLDPPHADNLVSLPVKGIGRVQPMDARRPA